MNLVAIVSLVFCVQLPPPCFPPGVQQNTLHPFGGAHVHWTWAKTPPHPAARGEGDTEVNQSGDCLVDIRRQLNTNRGTA
jgi:hypothetical protein